MRAFFGPGLARHFGALQADRDRRRLGAHPAVSHHGGFLRSYSASSSSYPPTALRRTP
jgi:hypothetical protein